MSSKAPIPKPGNDRGKQRRKRLLTAVRNDPNVLFTDSRCRKPELCEDVTRWRSRSTSAC